MILEIMCTKDVSAVLKEFKISERVGFMLENPAVELPLQFAPWQQICDSMPTLIAGHKIREAIEQLPLINVSSIDKYEQQRLAHLLLATMAAGYIWHAGENEATLFLPPQIAVPFWEISQRLKIKACATYLTTCLANWRLADPTLPICALNMRTVAFRFVEDFGNEWFFLNSAQIEIDFAPALIEMTRACVLSDTVALTEINDHQQQQDLLAAVLYALDVLAHTLQNATTTLGKMKQHLSPTTFYYGFRRFCRGFTNGVFETQGGLIFRGVDGIGPQPFTGGSAAQSSTIQAADSFLGIKHGGAHGVFLLEQREYMSPDHKRFLEFLDSKSPVQRLLPSSPKLKVRFDECTDALVSFRNQHLQIVTSYIIIAQKNGDDNCALADRGTGGTEMMTFLKAVRNGTNNRAVQGD